MPAAPGDGDNMIHMPSAVDFLPADTADTLVAFQDLRAGDFLPRLDSLLTPEFRDLLRMLPAVFSSGDSYLAPRPGTGPGGHTLVV